MRPVLMGEIVGVTVARGTTCFGDLEHARIAVVDGSVSMRQMRAALPDATLVVTRLSAGCLESVTKGEANAASNDLINLMMLQAATDHPELYDIIDVGDRFDPKPFGIAVKKGRQDLVGPLNAAIESL